MDPLPEQPVPGEEPAAAYYQDVEEHFVSRRGDPLFLSNADWDLARRWRQRGIPLRIVLRGIDDALDSHLRSWGRERPVRSLRYCAAEVEAAYDRWREALGPSREVDAGHTKALHGLEVALEGARDLGAEAAACIEGIRARLTAWGTRPPTHALERGLLELETSLLDALRRQHGKEDLVRLSAEAAAVLARYEGRMPTKLLDDIRQDAVARRLLSLHGLPRLSLVHE